MSRIKLDLPVRFQFRTEISLRIGDINYGGHLGNDSVLSLCHEARVRMLKTHGFTELNIDGCGLIMTDSVVVYVAEAFYGDVLNIEVAVTDVGATGCNFMYRLSNKETGKEVARGKTGIVFFDYERRKPVAVPGKFRLAFSNDERG
jgi:acyl-CoA thioester hydrolase